MNIVSIILLLMLGLSVISGYRQGLVRVLLSMVAWILIAAFVYWSTPFISTAIKEKTPVYTLIEQNIEKSLEKKAKEQISENSQSPVSILGIELPEETQKQISELVVLGETGLAEGSGIIQGIASNITDGAVGLLSLVLAILGGWLVWSILAHALDLVTSLPLIHGINHGLGALAGGIKGILSLWLFFYVLRILPSLTAGSYLIAGIKENPLLAYLYYNNVLEQLISAFL